MPFGAGSRSKYCSRYILRRHFNKIIEVCLGMHLARIELRLAAALFFRAFPNARISAKEGMSKDDMEQNIFFMMAPMGHRCLIEVVD